MSTLTDKGPNLLAKNGFRDDLSYKIKKGWKLQKYTTTRTIYVINTKIIMEQ